MQETNKQNRKSRKKSGIKKEIFMQETNKSDLIKKLEDIYQLLSQYNEIDKEEHRWSMSVIESANILKKHMNHFEKDILEAVNNILTENSNFQYFMMCRNNSKLEIYMEKLKFALDGLKSGKADTFEEALHYADTIKYEFYFSQEGSMGKRSASVCFDNEKKIVVKNEEEVGYSTDGYSEDTWTYEQVAERAEGYNKIEHCKKADISKLSAKAKTFYDSIENAGVKDYFLFCANGCI